MDTFGWDTNYVLTINRINEGLNKNQEKLIMSFDTDVTNILPLKATGKFSKWQVVEGGSGTILYLNITIREGTVIYYNTGKTFDITGVAMTVAVQLSLVSSSDTNTLEELKFQFDSVGEIGQPPAPGVVTPVSLTGATDKLDEAERVLLLIGLSNYLVAKASSLTYVFATINIVPPSSNTWLTPVKSAYMYLSREQTNGSLAILSVTTDKDISTLPLMVDKDMLSPSYDASFGLSKELFLRNVIQPALPSVFGNGASSESFVYDMPNGNLRNTRDLNMNGVTWGAITYYPKVVAFRLTTTGGGLSSSYEGSCDLKAGLSMKFWVSTNNNAVYNGSSKSISFLPDPSPSSKSDVDIPWYWWFLGPIARGIMELIVQAIAESISSSMTVDAANYLTITKNPPTSIQWQGLDNLDIQNGALNLGFYMQGNPV